MTQVSQKKFNPIKGTSFASTTVSNVNVDYQTSELELFASDALKYVKLDDKTSYDPKNSLFAFLEGFVLPESLNDVTLDFSYTTLENADSTGKYRAIKDDEKSYWKSLPLTRNLNHKYLGNSHVRIARGSIEVPGHTNPKPCLYVTNVNPNIPLMGFKITLRDIPKLNAFPNSSTYVALKTDDKSNFLKVYSQEEGITLNHNLSVPIDQIIFNIIDGRNLTSLDSSAKRFPGLTMIKSIDPASPQTVLDGFMSISGMTPNPGEFNLKFHGDHTRKELFPDALLVNVSGATVTIVFTDSSPKASKSDSQIVRGSGTSAVVKIADKAMQIPWTYYWDKATGKAVANKVFNVIGQTIENGTENRRMKFRQIFGDLLPNKKADGTQFINDGKVLFVSKPILPGRTGPGWGSGVANPDDESEIRLAFYNTDFSGKFTVVPFVSYADAPKFNEEIDLHLGDINFEFEQNQATFSANLKMIVNWKN